MLKSTVTALRGLLERQRILTVAVLVDGAPYAGLLPFVPLPDRSGVLVHASRLAKHSHGLGDGARIGLLLHEPDAPDRDPLQLPRMMFDCVVRPLERASDAWQEGKAAYVQRFPDSVVTFGLADFTLYRLEFQAGVYVAGFGRAIAVPATDIAKLAQPA